MRVPSAVLESVADCREESGHALPLTNTDNWRQRRWWSCEAELGLRVCWVIWCRIQKFWFVFIVVSVNTTRGWLVGISISSDLSWLEPKEITGRKGRVGSNNENKNICSKNKQTKNHKTNQPPTKNQNNQKPTWIRICLVTRQQEFMKAICILKLFREKVSVGETLACVGEEQNIGVVALVL